MRLLIILFTLPLWGESSPLYPFLESGRGSNFSFGGRYDQKHSYTGYASLQKDWENVRLGLVGCVERKPTKAIDPSTISFPDPSIKKSLYGGIHLRSFGFYLRADGGAIPREWVLSLQMHPEKVIYLFTNHWDGFHRSGIGILSGAQFQVGLELGKTTGLNNTSFDGLVSLTYKTSFASLGILETGEENSPGNTSVLFGFNSERKETEALTLEESPFSEDDEFKMIKKPHKPLSYPIDHPFHKSKPILPMNLQDLLSNKISLREALQILKAEKNREEFENLLKTLPSDTVKKVKKIQYEKSKSLEGFD